MRVITGTAGGRPLKTLSGQDVRPTVAKVKEALFSSIQFEVEGAKVLDLFAGSGQLGLECLSRGAQSVTFVDASKASLSVVEGNLSYCGLLQGATLIHRDSIAYLSSCSEYFDIVLLDPPYNTDLVDRSLELLSSLTSSSAVVVCETPATKELPESVGELTLTKTKKYGSSRLTYYRKVEE